MSQNTVGRQVHFVDDQGVHRPATISALTANSSTLDLHVLMPFHDQPVVLIEAVPADQDGHIPLTWHWPERV